MITQQLRDAKKLASIRFLKRTPSVVAVGIGNKEIAGQDTGIASVRIYVSKLFEVDELSIQSLVPKEILGVPTDVIELAPAFFNPLSAFTVAIADAPSNLNPILGGTVGAVVVSGGNRFILGTNHSLAANGRVPAGKPVGPVVNPIGRTLAGRFVELLHAERNRADCALAQLVGTSPPGVFIIDRPDKVGEPQLGQRVQKGGVGTTGTIVDVSVDFFVDYSFATVLLEDQIFVKGGNGDFARQGESGAILVANDTGKAVAMVFASAGKFTAACPLQPALELLGVVPGANVPGDAAEEERSRLRAQ
jgi:hypothetical protein